MQIPVSAPYEAGAWSRTVIDVYILWFTFLVASNTLAMAWVFGRRIEDGARPMAGPMCWVLVLVNLLTVGSTIEVASVVRTYAPPGFDGLVLWAAIANSIVVVAFAAAWFLYWRMLRKLGSARAGF
jgi:cytochrome c oxidase assembly factor CtaG